MISQILGLCSSKAEKFRISDGTREKSGSKKIPLIRNVT